MLRVAAYLRLSRKDGDKAESDSIGSQRELINGYIAKHKEFELYDWYIDDDYTGTNFNRPGFIQMMNAIEDGFIDVVIVKDLSRFGRDYVDTGRYLQKVFPRLGIRFIAIADNIDSGKRAYDMLMPIKNIFNEQYARDISNKVLTSLVAKKEAGQFIGAFASYGYMKSPEDKNRLIVDPYAAEVVRRIFNLFIQGEGKQAIARILNDEKVLCPSEYKRSLNLNYQNCNRLPGTVYWTYSTINNILKNEMYAGTMVQSKQNHSRYNIGVGRDVPEEQWVKVNNTHEAIISRDTWETAQSLLKRRTRQLDFHSNVTPYAGFLKCADCGRAMSKVTSDGADRFICGSYKRYGKDVCSYHRIFLRDLDAVMINLLNEKLKAVHNLIAIAESAENERSKTLKKQEEPISQQIGKLKIRLEKVSRTKRELYDDYKSKLITKEEYIQYKEDYQKQEDALNEQIRTLEATSAGESNIIAEHPWLRSFKETKQITEITRPILESMVEEIIIHEDNKIQVKYKFDLEGISPSETVPY